MTVLPSAVYTWVIMMVEMMIMMVMVMMRMMLGGSGGVVQCAQSKLLSCVFNHPLAKLLLQGVKVKVFTFLLASVAGLSESF